MERTRIDSFDILKSIAIFLVIFCHFVSLTDAVIGNFCMTICYVGVPLFFMVNGALLMQKPFNLKAHLIKTLWVYVVGTVWRVIYLIFDCLKDEALAKVLELKQQTLSYLFLWGGSQLTSPDHMWFMKALLAVYLIFPLLHFCFKGDIQGKKVLLFLLCVLFVGVKLITETDMAIAMLNKYFGCNILFSTAKLTSFLPYSNAMAVFYFVLGALLFWYLVEAQKNETFIMKPKYRILAAGAFVVSWILMMWTKSLVDGTWRWTGVLYSGGYSRIPTLLATVSLFLLTFGIKVKEGWAKKLIRAISSYTLGIYYMHWIVAQIFVHFIDGQGFAYNTLKTVAVLAVCLGMSCVAGRIPLIKRLVK